MSLGDHNIAIAEYVYKQLLEAISTEKEIILIDRSINDRQIWNYRRYLKGEISDSKYQEIRDKYLNISKELIDFLVITYAEPLASLKRDYYSSLALEKRNFLNLDNLNEYNESLKDLEDLFQQSVDNFILLDTTTMNMSDVSIEVAKQIMTAMRKKYIKSFKKQYNLK